MRWSTPWRVLVGSRSAILEAAGSRWSLAVGAVLVLSASLARKYDTTDLLAEPHELLHGFAATIVNALGLHGFMWLFATDKPRPAFWSSYFSFLGVFWLAAPMGWVYGVPYERFLSPVQAANANLWTLMGVSVLRVLWMTHLLNVLWGARRWETKARTFFAVMMWSDLVAVVALVTAPLPTLDVMGSLQQPEDVRVIASAAFLARAIAVLTSWVWLFGGICAATYGGYAWRAGPAQRGVSWGAAAPGLVAVAAWCSALPFTQPPVRNAHRAEVRCRSGDFAGLLAELSGHHRGDYPAVWEPPPAIWSDMRERPSRIPRIAAGLRGAADLAPWVRKAYHDKVLTWTNRAMNVDREYDHRSIFNADMSRTDVEMLWQVADFYRFDELVECLEYLAADPGGYLKQEQREYARELIEAGRRVKNPRR